MYDMSNIYYVGEIDKLQLCGIDTEPLRKSLDGIKAVVHHDLLSKEQFDALRPKTSILCLTFAEAQALSSDPEWAAQE